MDATDEAVVMMQEDAVEKEEGPTPRDRFHEQLRAREAKKNTPYERQNRLKKKTTTGEGTRRRRTELDHCAWGALVAERFDTKKRFECWRCDEPKESRILYKWHVVAPPEPSAADGAAQLQREAAPEGGEEGEAQKSVKTICLGCYGHLLSLRKGRDAPAPASSRELLEPQPEEMADRGADHEQPQRRGGGHGEGVATDQASQIPTVRAPHPHKRREKKHARVSYVTPKGMRGGRGRGRGGSQPAPPTHE